VTVHATVNGANICLAESHFWNICEFLSCVHRRAFVYMPQFLC